MYILRTDQNVLGGGGEERSRIQLSVSIFVFRADYQLVGLNESLCLYIYDPIYLYVLNYSLFLRQLDVCMHDMDGTGARPFALAIMDCMGGPTYPFYILGKKTFNFL